jgi:hypothetical protein
MCGFRRIEETDDGRKGEELSGWLIPYQHLTLDQSIRHSELDAL